MFRLSTALPGSLWGLYLFAKGVWDGGVMDYKQYGTQYDPYGNYTYGAVGRAAGYPSSTLMRMSGWAHYKFDLGLPANLGRALGENPPPYWDNATDRGNISAGAQYYDNRCFVR